MNKPLHAIAKFLLNVSVTFLLLTSTNSIHAQDTLKVMTYNVLNYGSGCQGSDSYLHGLLKTVVQYSSPDLLGLVKVHSIKVNSSDTYGKMPVGFADSINNYALNAAFPGKYAYCTLTDYAHSADNNMDILYYNQNKLGFLSVTLLCNNQEDFDLFKLYYKDPNLSTTHDTTFLYAVLNHTISNSNGGGVSAGRDSQDSAVINSLKAQFTHLPNLISMGDFNTASSIEPGYQYYVAGADSSYLFYDPPFSLDNKATYPCFWNQNSVVSSFLNTPEQVLPQIVLEQPPYPFTHLIPLCKALVLSCAITALKVCKEMPLFETVQSIMPSEVHFITIIHQPITPTSKPLTVPMLETFI